MNKINNRKITFTMVLMICVYMMMATISLAANNDVLAVKVNRNLISWQDVQPFVDTNNRTLIPMRDLGNALNLEVMWDNNTNQVSFIKTGSIDEFPSTYKDLAKNENTMKIVFTLNSSAYKVYFNEELQAEKTMDTKLVAKNSRVFAPLRYLATEFGYDVRFSSFTHTINVENSDNEPITYETNDVMYYTLDNQTTEEWTSLFYTMLVENRPEVVVYCNNSNLDYHTEIKPALDAGYKKAVLLYPEIKAVIKNYGVDYTTRLQATDDYTNISSYIEMKVYFNFEEDGLYHHRLAELGAEDLHDWMYLSGTLNSSMDEVEKASTVRKYFLTNGTYDKISDSNYSPHTVFQNGYGKCSAYTGAFKMMMDLEDIYCYSQNGGAAYTGKTTGHIWNIASLNGIKYYIDATPTWDKDEYFTPYESVFRKSHNWEE